LVDWDVFGVTPPVLEREVRHLSGGRTERTG